MDLFPYIPPAIDVSGEDIFTEAENKSTRDRAMRVEIAFTKDVLERDEDEARPKYLERLFLLCEKYAHDIVDILGACPRNPKDRGNK